jgi:hypothetical protein
MSKKTQPDELPYGESEYRNYDPKQINTPEKAVEVLEWISDENANEGNIKASQVFGEAADFIDRCLVDD